LSDWANRGLSGQWGRAFRIFILRASTTAVVLRLGTPFMGGRLGNLGIIRVEFDGVLRPIRGDRRRKIGKNKIVLKAVDMLKHYTGSSYFLILTPEMWRDEMAAHFQTIQTFGLPGDSMPGGSDISR
jgi:hypothetical protein